MKKALTITIVMASVFLSSCGDHQRSLQEDPLIEDDSYISEEANIDNLNDDDIAVDYGNCYDPNDATNQELSKDNILYNIAVRNYFFKNTEAPPLRMTAEKVRTFNYENGLFAGYELRCKIVEEDLPKIEAAAGSTVSVSMFFLKELHTGLVPPQDEQVTGRIFTVEMRPLFWGSRTGELCSELIAVVRTEKGALVAAMMFIGENSARSELDIWPSTILPEFDAWLATPVNCPKDEDGQSQPPLTIKNKVSNEQIEVLPRHVGTMKDYSLYVAATGVNVEGKESSCFTTSGFLFSIYSRKFMEGSL